MRKAMRPDAVSGWIPRECANLLEGSLYDILMGSLKDDIPMTWKRAYSPSVYKVRQKRPTKLLACEEVCRLDKVFRKDVCDFWKKIK